MAIEQYMQVAKHFNDSYQESINSLEGFKKDNFISGNHSPEKSFYSVLLIPSARQQGKEVTGYVDYNFDDVIVFISQYIEQFGSRKYTIELAPQINAKEKKVLDDILKLTTLSFEGTDISPEIECKYAGEKTVNQFP